MPEFVAAFERLATRDYVWLDIATDSVGAALQHDLGLQTEGIDLAGLLGFSRLLCRIIDFKSEFTATHSSGVAAAGTELARLVGFSRDECRMFEIAAYLHDLGKLAVPSEILEKPGKLGAGEWDAPGLRQAVAELAGGERPFQEVELEHEFPGVGRRAPGPTPRSAGTAQWSK